MLQRYFVSFSRIIIISLSQLRLWLMCLILTLALDVSRKIPILSLLHTGLKMCYIFLNQKNTQGALWQGIGKNAEFVMENLPASRLGSLSQLPWTLTNSLHHLSFWNGKPRVCLVSELPKSRFSQNQLSGMPPWSLLMDLSIIIETCVCHLTHQLHHGHCALSIIPGFCVSVINFFTGTLHDPSIVPGFLWRVQTNFTGWDSKIVFNQWGTLKTGTNDI